MTKNFRYSTDGILSVPRIDVDLRDHFVALKRPVSSISSDIYFKRDLCVVRRNISGYAQGNRLSDHPLPEHDVVLDISLLYRPSETVKSSDNRLYAVLEDPCHLGLCSFALSVVSAAVLVHAPSGNPHLYSVSVDGAARAALRDKQVSFKSLNGHKSETSCIAVESSCKYLFSLVLPHLLYVFFSSSVIFCIVTSATLLGSIIAMSHGDKSHAVSRLIASRIEKHSCKISQECR